MGKKTYKKKFNFAAFDPLAPGFIREVRRAMPRPANFPKKLTTILDDVHYSRGKLKVDKCQKLLGEVRKILKEKPVFLHKGRAELLWTLIKSASANKDKERVDLWFEFLELTKGCLLLDPDAAIYLVAWKWGGNNRLMKRFVNLIKLGNEGKRTGGLKRAWSPEENAEYFARVHDIILRRHLSLYSATKIVAKDYKKSRKVLETKYRDYLRELKYYLNDEEIKRAVSRSLPELEQ